MKVFGPALLLIVFSTFQICYSQNHEPGIIRVKFKEKSLPAVDRLSLKQGSFGINAIDQYKNQFRIKSIKRVFRHAGKFEKAHKKFGLHLWYEIAFDGIIPVKNVLQAYSSIEEFEVVEAKTVYYKIDPIAQRQQTFNQSSLSGTTNDPDFDDQWHYENTGQSGGTVGADISLPEAWQIETGSSDVIVAVIDGGIDQAHHDIHASMWINDDEIAGNNIDDDHNGYVDDIYGYGFGDDTGSIPADDHGTHVGGTIAAVTNNNIGVSGIAGGSGSGDGVRVMSCAAFGMFGNGGFEDAMIYAADNGAVISQNSWGGGGTAIEDAIDYFIARAGYDNSDENFDDNIQIGPMAGGLVVFAAGNSSATYGYPAIYEPVMAVASTDHNDAKSWFSNYGSWIDISAPGSEVLSTTPGNTYSYFSGTSMACPHVSGVAALVISEFGPALTPELVWERLQTTSDNINAANGSYIGQLGAGRLNAFKAVYSDDDEPPVAIADLAVTSAESDNITIEWTSPGSSGNEGVATRYEIRYATFPLNIGNFSSGELVASPPKPKIAGSLESFKIGGLSHTTHYYVAIVSYDYPGNASALSNVVETSTAAPPLIEATPSGISEGIFTDDIITRSISIMNLGASVLRWTIELSEPWLSIEENTGVVSPGELIDVVLTIDGTDMVGGYYNGSVIINSNDPVNEQLEIPIDLNVNDAPNISLEGELNFGFAYPSLSTEEIDVIVRNKGNEQLNIGEVLMAGSSYFTISDNTPFVLNPDEERTLTITYSPGAIGQHTAEITFESNDPDQPSLTLSAIGEAVEAPLTISPSSIESTQLQNRTVNKAIGLTNVSGIDLGWKLMIDGYDANNDLISKREALNESYSSITNLIPNKYSFSGGTSGSYIDDGGNDMYDGGNFLNTNLASSIAYSDNLIQSGINKFGSGSEYFTRKFDGLFVLAVDNMNITNFNISGNLGADSYGLANATVLTLSFNGKTYKGFVKRVYNAYDPSVNHLIIVENNGSVSHSIASNTDSDSHAINSLNGISSLDYLLFAGDNGYFIDDAAMLQIMQQYLNATNRMPGWFNVDEYYGNLSAGQVDEVGCNFFSAGIDFGTHTTELAVSFPGSQYPDLKIPVEMNVVSLPDISAPAVIQLNKVFISVPGDTVVVIKNIGTEPLNVSLIESDLSEFSVSFEPFSLLPGEEHHAGVSFISDVPGNFTGTLTITSNDPDTETLEVKLEAAAVLPPVIEISPSEIVQNVYTDDIKTIDINLSNTGGSELNWQADVTADWLSLQTFSGSIEADNNASIGVIIDATDLSSGPYSASVIIRSNDPLNPELTIPVEINISDASNISVDVNPLDFGKLYINLSVQEKVVAVSNVGSSILEVTSVTLEGNSYFELMDSEPFSVDPGATKSIAVRYTPTGIGNHQAVLILDSNDPDHPLYEVEISGEGVYTPFIISPSNIASEQKLNTSVKKAFKLTNTSSEAMDYKLILGESENTNLDGLLLSLNSSYQDITSLIPNRFNFFEGVSGSMIDDGGNDMYDGGNMISTNIGGGPISYCDNAIVSNPSLGMSSSMFTRKFDGLFVFAAQNIEISTLTIDGNLGADGSGSVDSNILTATINGRNYKGFVKRVFNAYDPSVNHLIIVEDNNEVSHSISLNTNSDFHQITNLEGNTHVYYLLFASTGGAYVDNAAMQQIMETFLSMTSIAPEWITLESSGGMLQAGASVNINTTFNSEDLNFETYTSYLHIAVPESAYPTIQIPVSLSVVSIPDFEASETHLDFGTRFINHPVEKYMSVTNTGTELLVIDTIYTLNQHYTVNKKDLKVRPGRTETLIVTYLADVQGDHDGELIFETNIVNRNTISIDLSGETIVPVPAIGISHSTIDFGKQVLNQAVHGTVWIYNTGTSTLNLDGMKSTTDAFSFFINSLQIVPGDSINLLITFKGSTTGLHAGKISFSTNVPNTDEMAILVQGESFIPATLESNLETHNLTMYANTEQIVALTIGNSGTETLHWALTSEVPLLSFDKLNGQLLSEEYYNVNVKISTLGLAPGNYSWSFAITYSDPDARIHNFNLNLVVIENRNPLLILAVPDQIVNLDADIVSLNLENYFADPDSTKLVYQYNVHDNGIADVFLEGTILNITPMAAGLTSVTISAEDQNNGKASDVFTIQVLQVTGVEQAANLKKLRNHPNPFNPVTVISYSLVKAGFVNILIKDVNGRTVASLVNEFQKVGNQQVIFDANLLSNGFYMYHLLVDGELADSGKMMKN